MLREKRGRLVALALLLVGAGCKAAAVAASDTTGDLAADGTKTFWATAIGFVAGVLVPAITVVKLAVAALVSAIVVIFASDSHPTVNPHPPLGDFTSMSPLLAFILGIVIALAIRNRHWLPFFFSSEAKGYRLALLWHFIAGGKPPVIPPQFLPDLAA